MYVCGLGETLHEEKELLIHTMEPLLSGQSGFKKYL